MIQTRSGGREQCPRRASSGTPTKTAGVAQLEHAGVRSGARTRPPTRAHSSVPTTDAFAATTRREEKRR